MKTKNNLRILKSILRHPIKFLKANKASLIKRTDFNRWEDIENLHEEWDERTIMIAQLIDPNSSVLEFGAGRLTLPKYLPKNCTYQPSDIVDRGLNTIVCDLNHSLPNLTSHYTHIVFSGVLEYIFDIDDVLNGLKEHTDTVIASYGTMDKISDYVTRIQSGWVNHYYDEQIISLFNKNNFSLEGTYSWGLQTIYVFEKSK